MADTTNYGMLGNIASGIREGLTAYQTTQNMNRQQQIENLLTGVQTNPITGDLDYTPQKKQELAVKAALTQRQADKLDPNSEISQNTRNTFKNILGPKGAGAIGDNSSAADLEDTGVGGLIKTKLQGENSADVAMTKGLMMANAYGSKAQDREDKNHSQALQQTQSFLESARGNPEVAQAQKDMYAAKKLDSLANLYGDPNKLSPAQVQLAASEVAKIASGGVPASHELQGLNPSTVPKSLAEAAQYFSNNPQAANSGAFVKQLQDYTSALKADAQGVIKEKFGRVIETRKKQLGDDNYQTLKDQYLAPFDTQAPTQGLVGSGGASAQPQTKVIGNKTYVKVPGGWQEQ